MMTEQRLTTHCPHCQAALRVADRHVGKKVRCQGCRQKFVVASVAFGSNAADQKAVDSTDTIENAGSVTDTTDGQLEIEFKSTSDPFPVSMSANSKPSPESDLGKLGRFELQRRLGHGGFGVVYLAYDPQLDRQVALKVPSFDSGDKKRIRRFLDEAKSAARLQHPNIVPVYDSGFADNRHYIAAGYVDGSTLSDRMKNDRSDLVTLMQWVRDLARALDYAHAEEIVHRDVKPDNVMIDQRGRPQLMDFGLAKRIDQDSSVTTDGSLLGTPAYMAPEQARGDIEQIGKHSDQYSLGVVLYEMLCGHRPFEGSPLMIVGLVGADTEPTAPRKVDAGIPKDLEAICLKAMAVRPADRYATTGELGDDIDRWLSREPIRARRISPVERFSRWIARNRIVASLTILTSTLLLAVAAVSTFSYFRQKTLLNETQTILAEKSELNTKLTQQTETAEIAKSQAEASREKAADEAKRATKEAEKARTKEAEAQAAAKRAVTAQKEQAKAEEARKLAAAAESAALIQQMSAQAAEQRQRVRSSLERGTTLASGGDAARGLQWMSKALQLLETIPDDSDKQSLDSQVRKAIQAELDGYPKLSSFYSLQEKQWPIAGESDAAKQVVPSAKNADVKLSGRFSPDGHLLAIQKGMALGVVRVSDGSFRFATAITATTPRFNQTVSNVSLKLGAPDGNSMSFSPNSNHLLVTTGCQYQVVNRQTNISTSPMMDCNAIILDAQSGKVLTQLGDSVALQVPVMQGTLTRSGRIAVLTTCVRNNNGDHINQLGVWNPAVTGPAALRLLPNLSTPSTTYPITHVVAGSNEQLVAICSGRTVRVIDLQSGSLVNSPMQHDSRITVVAISDDGKFLAVGTEEGTTWLWPLGSDAPIHLRHQQKVTSLHFNQDASLLVTSSQDRTVRIWSTDLGEAVGRPVDHEGEVVAVTFAGKYIQSLDDAGRVKRFEIPSQETDLRINEQPITAAFNSTGRIVLITYQNSADRRVKARLIDTVSGRSIYETETRRNQVTNAVWTADGNRFLLAGTRQVTLILNPDQVSEGEPPAIRLIEYSDSLRASGTRQAVKSLAGSTNARVIVVGTENGEVRLSWKDEGRWRWKPGKEISSTPVTAIAISPDASRVAAVTDNSNLHILNSKNPTQIHKSKNLHQLHKIHPGLPRIKTVSFSPNGQLLVVGGESQDALIIRVEDGVILGSPLTHPPGHSVREAYFIKEGRMVATETESGLFVWDIQDRRLINSFAGQPGSAYAISQDGAFYLSGSSIRPVPVPIEGTTSALAKQITRSTGMTLDEAGRARFLTPKEWSEEN